MPAVADIGYGYEASHEFTEHQLDLGDIFIQNTHKQKPLQFYDRQKGTRYVKLLLNKWK